MPAELGCYTRTTAYWEIYEGVRKLEDSGSGKRWRITRNSGDDFTSVHLAAMRFRPKEAGEKALVRNVEEYLLRVDRASLNPFKSEWVLCFEYELDRFCFERVEKK